MRHLLLARPDGDEHIVDVFESHLLADLALGAHRRGRPEAESMLLQLVRELVAPRQKVVVAVHAREVGADLAACRRRLRKLEPIARRACALLREDLHAVAHLQLVGKRHDRAVHLRADAVVAHLGVHGVGEIDRRGARTQAYDLACRREDEDLGRREIDLELAEVFARILGLVLKVDHLAQPGDLLVEGRIRLGALLLVAPVRGDAVFAHAMHVLGADLHLERPARRTDDRRVQALVHVYLRHGDVVFETARHRMPP